MCLLSLDQAGGDKETIQRLAKLSSVLSQSRKLFRIGKFYESYTSVRMRIFIQIVEIHGFHPRRCLCLTGLQRGNFQNAGQPRRGVRRDHR